MDTPRLWGFVAGGSHRSKYQTAVSTSNDKVRKGCEHVNGASMRGRKVDAMDALLPYLVLAAGVAVVMAAFTLLALRIRRRGTAGGGLGGALAAYEEAFRA